MSGKNKFGFEPIDQAEIKPRRRDVGPMGAAVREAASSLNESTETLMEQRRQNASDAKEFRQAQVEGRVLVEIPLDDILSDDLPRDRLDLDAVANSDEMKELKDSIRARGQKEPIEVYRFGEGYQLKKGWRRLTALKQLRRETNDDRYSKVVARVTEGSGNRLDLYVDMVEENVIREDLSFAEMAQVAIVASREPGMEGRSADELVGSIYASLHKMKRSYIKHFVRLLGAIGEDLRFPKDLSRNLGAEVDRVLERSPELIPGLRASLAGCETKEEQKALLEAFVANPSGRRNGDADRSRQKSVKYEFRVGSSKVTARKGECRILSKVDFSAMDRDRLRKAIEAFEAVLAEG